MRMRCRWRVGRLRRLRASVLFRIRIRIRIRIGFRPQFAATRGNLRRIAASGREGVLCATIANSLVFLPSREEQIWHAVHFIFLKQADRDQPLNRVLNRFLCDRVLCREQGIFDVDRPTVKASVIIGRNNQAVENDLFKPVKRINLLTALD